MEKFELCDDIGAGLTELQNNLHSAVAVSHSYVLNTRQTGELNIQCLKNAETIYEYGLKILMKKDFQYVDDLNKLLRHADEAGLIKKWLSIREAKFKSGPTKVDPLNLKFLEVFFYILGASAVLTTTIFIWEMIIHEKAREFNRSKFWVWAEIFIDPERYFLLNNYYE